MQISSIANSVSHLCFLDILLGYVVVYSSLIYSIVEFRK